MKQLVGFKISLSDENGSSRVVNWEKSKLMNVPQFIAKRFYLFLMLITQTSSFST